MTDTVEVSISMKFPSCDSSNNLLLLKTTVDSLVSNNAKELFETAEKLNTLLFRVKGRAV